MPPVSSALYAPSISGSSLVKSADFPFQSFFDSTQLGQAILMQPPNELIIPATSLAVPIPCYGAALHPDSQVPIAVKFKANVATEESTTYLLTPGEVIHPHEAPFSGLVWGLPFGWLGGGSAQLVIFKSSDADVRWPVEKAEVVIQRQRAQIQADGAAPTFSYGLPTRFPWINAQRYNVINATTPFQQPGAAVIAVEPTRTIFKLRMTALAAPQTVRVLVQYDQPFSTAAESIAIDVTFPLINGLAPWYPTQEIQLPFVLHAGDNAKFALVDQSGGVLLNQYVDIVRYGRI